eukprot:scaffold113267_cov48-Phaeocystis_antarctica.AAC.1
MQSYMSAHGSLDDPQASALHVLLGVAVVVRHREAVVRAVDADDPPGVVAATVGLVGASRQLLILLYEVGGCDEVADCKRARLVDNGAGARGEGHLWGQVVARVGRVLHRVVDKLALVPWLHRHLLRHLGQSFLGELQQVVEVIVPKLLEAVTVHVELAPRQPAAQIRLRLRRRCHASHPRKPAAALDLLAGAATREPPRRAKRCGGRIGDGLSLLAGRVGSGGR